MKKFFAEFKKFITRGNVVDMAVGVIIGGAFTAIVTALTDNILRPLINWVISLCVGSTNTAVYTFLKGDISDLSSAIYIDWGAFISAIINFLLIAFVLFCIVKTLNKISERGKQAADDLKTERLAIEKYKAEGLTKKQAVEKYKSELKAEEEAKKAEEKAEAEKAKKEAEEKALANTKLLEEIRDLLKNQKQ